MDEHGVFRAATTGCARPCRRTGTDQAWRRGAGRTDASGRAGRWCCDVAPGRLQPRMGGGRPMWDLVVTLDDATSEVWTRAFSSPRKRTIAVSRRFRRCPPSGACSARLCRSVGAATGTRRESPAARSMIKDNPTQVGRALQKQLGIELNAAYSPEARGRSERMFGTLSEAACPRSCATGGGGRSPRQDANRFLKEVFWLATQRRALPGRLMAAGSASWPPAISDRHRLQAGAFAGDDVGAL